MNLKNDETLSLFDITKILWRGRRTLLICLGVFYLVSFAYVLFSEKQYSTSLVMSPIQDERSAQIGNLVKVITGNDSTGSSRPEGMAEFVHLLTSPIVAEELIKDDRILKEIFKSEWDEKTKTWHPPQSLTSFAKRSIYWILGYPGYAQPSAYRLSEYLKRALVIEQLKGSRLYSVTLLTADRGFGEYLVDQVFHFSDKFLRQKKIEKTYQTLTHLNKRIETVENMIHRKSLSDLLLFYEQELILLETDQPFAARKLGDSRSSDWPASPRLKLIFILATALSLLFGSGLLLLKLRLQKS